MVRQELRFNYDFANTVPRAVGGGAVRGDDYNWVVHHVQFSHGRTALGARYMVSMRIFKKKKSILEP